jgi:hypothetical protein
MAELRVDEYFKLSAVSTSYIEFEFAYPLGLLMLFSSVHAVILRIE